VASALRLTDPRLRQVKGDRHLPQLRAVLHAKIVKVERVEEARIP